MANNNAANALMATLANALSGAGSGGQGKTFMGMSADALSAELARFQDTQVVRRGSTITIPDGMSIPTAIAWLQRRMEEDAKKVQPNESVNGFPLDVAHALQLAVHEIYGFREARDVETFFGPILPSFVSVPIDHHGNTVEVLTGRFGVPGFEKDDYLETYPTEANDGIVITGSIAQKHMDEFKQLVSLTKTKLRENSLYRGRAIQLDYGKVAKDRKTGQAIEGFVAPTFLPPPPPNTELILNADTMSMVEATIWNPLRHSDEFRANGISLRRGNIIIGPYGTGKTLLATLTAPIATQNGWTFIYLKNIERLADAYLFAKRYGRCVIFAEDLDTILKNGVDLNKFQNDIDGVTSKDAEIMLIVTTNFSDEIPPSLWRGGRFDMAHEFGYPNAAAIERLVRHYSGDLLDEAEDLSRVSASLAAKQFIPANVAEVVKRAKMVQYGLNGSHHLTSVALEGAAKSMLLQNEMLNRKPPAKQSAAEQIGAEMGRALNAAAATLMVRQNPAAAERDQKLDAQREASVTAPNDVRVTYK